MITKTVKIHNRYYPINIEIEIENIINKNNLKLDPTINAKIDDKKILIEKTYLCNYNRLNNNSYYLLGNENSLKNIYDKILSKYSCKIKLTILILKLECNSDKLESIEDHLNKIINKLKSTLAEGFNIVKIIKYNGQQTTIYIYLKYDIKFIKYYKDEELLKKMFTYAYYIFTNEKDRICLLLRHNILKEFEKFKDINKIELQGVFKNASKFNLDGENNE